MFPLRILNSLLSPLVGGDGLGLSGARLMGLARSKLSWLELLSRLGDLSVRWLEPVDPRDRREPLRGLKGSSKQDTDAQGLGRQECPYRRFCRIFAWPDITSGQCGGAAVVGDGTGDGICSMLMCLLDLDNKNKCVGLVQNIIASCELDNTDRSVLSSSANAQWPRAWKQVVCSMEASKVKQLNYYQ